MSSMEINIADHRALAKAMGFDGMVCFFRQFEQGSGNYTLDRCEWLDALSLDEIFADMETRQNKAREE